MTWDGKERRKNGEAAERRARIDELKREWEATTPTARQSPHTTQATHEITADDLTPPGAASV
jgi:hypothetical protein